MKIRIRIRIRLIDIMLALLSGLLSAAAFPKFNLSFFIWISLIPLLFIISNKTPKQSFLLGMTAGFSFYAVLLYWIPDVPAHFGNLSIGLSILIYVVLILFLSLFWAFFSLSFSLIRKTFPLFAFILAPFLWVVFEYALAHILTGFPWGLIGYAQYQNLLFIQLASLTGIYGLSFFLVLFQSLFVLSIKTKKRNFFFIGLVLILFIHLGGFLSLKKITPSPESFKASVIQGNVSSDIYWPDVSYEEIQQIFDEHLDLTNAATFSDSQLIIWPEFSVPLCFSCPSEFYQNFKRTLLQYVQETGRTLLLGTNEMLPYQDTNQYFNTALCLSPDLSYTEYHKIHLVPFGEYIPYKKLFSFINKMTHAIGEITPGKELRLHSFRTTPFGSPICYEIIFPNLVRKFTKNGAMFLTTLTNDGWYGQSSAPYQHFAIAVMRAVENRRFLLRAATTGISGIIDPFGRILVKSELETQTFLTSQITPLSSKTLYSSIGDVLAYISLTLSGLFLILAIIRKNK
ncbi:apolipoprotein N-acyltransferase [Acidobacteriota bacterium]